MNISEGLRWFITSSVIRLKTKSNNSARVFYSKIRVKVVRVFIIVIYYGLEQWTRLHPESNEVFWLFSIKHKPQFDLTRGIQHWNDYTAVLCLKSALVYCKMMRTESYYYE